MSIQWFPGHMNSARRNAAEAMEHIDVVIEVVDARLPQASCNPMIHELRLFRQRPCLKLLNKADLADPDATKAWLAYFNAQKGVKAVAVSCKKPADVARVTGWCRSLAPHRGTSEKQLRLMIMGIPNVGKSTLMNALLKRKVAAVGDQPAVTKTQQRLDLNDSITLTDTPGMLWPKIEYPSDGYMLAASHAVGTNAVNDEEVAAFLGDFLLQNYAELIPARYGLGIEGLDGVGLVEAIAKRRGFRVKGGDLDLEKAAIAFLKDYRTGVLGRISLETPESRAKMMADVKAMLPVMTDDSAGDAEE